MSEYFEITNASKPTFGDYVTIEMKRYGVPNEYFIHEVLTQPFISNSWRVVPIVSSQKETLHKTTEAVISVRSSSGLPIFNVRVCDILPMVGDKWCWKESPLRARIAELEEFKMIVEGCGFEVITEPPVLNYPKRKILKGHGTIYVPELPEPEEVK